MGLFPRKIRSDTAHYGDEAFKSGASLDFESGSALKIDGTSVSASANELSVANGAPFGVSFTIGAEAANAINVAIQLRDADGAVLAVRGSVFAYLSDDANGDSIVGTAPDGGWAIGTDGLLIPVVADKAAQLVSESDGDIDITITESAAKTVYLIVRLPNGKLVASNAITFAL